MFHYLQFSDAFERYRSGTIVRKWVNAKVEMKKDCIVYFGSENRWLFMFNIVLRKSLGGNMILLYNMQPSHFAL